MGEVRKDVDVKISDLSPGDLVVVGESCVLSFQEGRAEAERLAEMPVPGFQEWMQGIPRRWFN